MKALSCWTLGLALAGVWLSGTAWAAQPAPPRVVDVALRDGGVLVGQVVDPQGQGLTGASVSLRVGNQWVSGRAVEQGYFAFKGLRGGVYQVVSEEGRGVFRVWTAGTAPPSAQSAALLVAGQDVVRGAECGADCCPPPDRFPLAKSVVTHPVFIASAVAAAIAIPVAIHNHHEASP